MSAVLPLAPGRGPKEHLDEEMRTRMEDEHREHERRTEEERRDFEKLLFDRSQELLKSNQRSNMVVQMIVALLALLQVAVVVFGVNAGS